MVKHPNLVRVLANLADHSLKSGQYKLLTETLAWLHHTDANGQPAVQLLLHELTTVVNADGKTATDTFLEVLLRPATPPDCVAQLIPIVFSIELRNMLEGRSVKGSNCVLKSLLQISCFHYSSIEESAWQSLSNALGAIGLRQTLFGISNSDLDSIIAAISKLHGFHSIIAFGIFLYWIMESNCPLTPALMAACLDVGAQLCLTKEQHPAKTSLACALLRSCLSVPLINGRQERRSIATYRSVLIDSICKLVNSSGSCADEDQLLMCALLSDAWHFETQKNSPRPAEQRKLFESASRLFTAESSLVNPSSSIFTAGVQFFLDSGFWEFNHLQIRPTLISLLFFRADTHALIFGRPKLLAAWKRALDSLTTCKYFVHFDEQKFSIFFFLPA